MEQNKFLFSTTRIPGIEQDTVRAPYTPEWPGLPEVGAIEFVLDDALRRDIEDAAASFAAYGAATATATVSFDGFGADHIKRLGMSPDAFVQMAYQLAHRRAKGLTGATYESVATRRYRHGRTEAMRVVTPEVLRFVEVMDDPAAGVVSRRDAFRAAADAHVRRAKECQSGQAPEQHLWELQLNVYLSTPRPVADAMGVFADRLRGAVRELRDLLA